MPEFEGVLTRRNQPLSFEFELEAGAQYIIDVVGIPSSEGRLRDATIEVFAELDLILFDDDSGPGAYPQATVRPLVSETYTVEVSGLGRETGGFLLRVFEDDFRNHPEGSAAAGDLQSAGASRGRINYDADADIHEVSLIRGLTYSLEALGSDSGSGSLADPELRVRNFSGLTIAADISDTGRGADDRLVYSPRNSGSHYLDVRSGDGDTGSYRVTASEGRGTQASDRINGTFRDDAIDARGGDDIVRGNEGDDVLEGGRGADRLVGGPGEDVFLFARATDSTSRNRDTIGQGPEGVAFGRPGRLDGDLIDLSGIDANRDRDGEQAFRFGSAEGVGRVWLAEEDQVTVVRANVDDDPRAEFVLAIADGEVRADEYRANDFVL